MTRQDLQQVLDQVCSIEHRIDQYEQQLQHLRELRDDYYGDVRRLILEHRCTTGDRLWDYTLTFHHGAEHEYQRLSQLEQSLVGRTGEFVLLAFFDANSIPIGLGDQDRQPRLHFYCGMLIHDQLVLSWERDPEARARDVGIPAGSFVTSGAPAGHPCSQPRSGPIQSPPLGGPIYPESLEPLQYAAYVSRLYVGTERVAQWLSEHLSEVFPEDCIPEEWWWLAKNPGLRVLNHIANICGTSASTTAG